jgi:hypothetical protein
MSDAMHEISTPGSARIWLRGWPLLLVTLACTTEPVVSSPDFPVENDRASASSDEGPIVGRRIDAADGAGAALVREGEGDSAPRFELAIGPAAAVHGEPASVSLSIEARGDWHVNLDYETALRVQADRGVTLTKPEQSRRDAKVHAENRIEFEVLFVAEESGAKRFSGRVRFALCRGQELCSVVDEPLDFEVAVN